MGGAGDVFGGMDAFAKKPLECYSCEGIDHPSFKCTSIKGARSTDMPRCPNCKGKGAALGFDDGVAPVAAQVDIPKVTPGIIKKAEDTIRAHPGIRAFLFECTEVSAF